MALAFWIFSSAHTNAFQSLPRPNRSLGSGERTLAIAVSPRDSRLLFVSQTGDDYSQTTEPRIRQAYSEWCRTFDKPYDELRLSVFRQNFLRMEKYAQQTGEQVRFNEYADLTTDEYRKMLGQQRRVVNKSNRSYGSETKPKGFDAVMRFMAYAQTSLAGGFIGGLSVLPAQALHYLYIQDYSYTTYGQWQWDWMVAVVQAGLFANIVRFALREDVDNSVVVSRLIWSLVVIKSLVRITVTPDCAAYTWVYCAEPFYIVNEEMGLALLINLLESWTLFMPVGSSIQSFLKRRKLPSYDGYEGDEDKK